MRGMVRRARFTIEPDRDFPHHARTPMKGMKWVIILNAALAGIVILIGSVFAFSWIRGATRPAPVAPVAVEKKSDYPRPLPLEVPPACTYHFDASTGELRMRVTNLSDQPLSYSSWHSPGEAVEVNYFVNGGWGLWSGGIRSGIRCGSGGEPEWNTFEIKAGQTKVFREYVLGKMFPVRYSLRLSSPDGRVSDITIGEYRPSTCFSQVTTK